MIDLKDKQIILASGSPRRRELLSAMDIPFTVDTGNTFDESWSEDTARKSAGTHGGRQIIRLSQRTRRQ